MDEKSLTEMRNYLTAAGLFIIALMLSSTVCMFVGYIPEQSGLSLFTGIGLIIVGIMLAVCRKRDLSAITFLMIGMLNLFLYFETITGMSKPSYYMIGPQTIIGIFFVILALIILTSNNRTKYILFVIPTLFGAGLILYNYPTVVIGIIVLSITMFFSLYLSIAAAVERINLPFSNLLKIDVDFDFKSSGSVLGYLLFGLSVFTNAVYYLHGYLVASGAIVYLEITLGLMLILTGVLLFTIGKMRFTPVMFILIGLSMMAMPYLTSGISVVVLGALIFVIGIMAVLRKESRILPGIMIIIYAIACIVHGIGIDVPVFLGLMNLFSAAIAIYLAFAVFSQSKKLKLF